MTDDEKLAQLEARIADLERHTHTTSPGGYTGGPIKATHSYTPDEYGRCCGCGQGRDASGHSESW